MKASDAVGNYKELQYRASDGRTYYLREAYPLIFSVGQELQNEEEEILFLDTGGQMASCDFFMAKITKGVLYRKDTKEDTFQPHARHITLKGVKVD